MRINTQLFTLSLAHRWAISGEPDSRARMAVQSLVVELEDDGHCGLGESVPSIRYGESVPSASAFLLKVNPARLSFDDLSASMRYFESLSPGEFSAKAALSVALLDGAARKNRMAMHEFLGLRFQEHHHVTSFSIGIAGPEVIRQKVISAAAFPILKLKVGGPEDRLNLEALRSAAEDKTVRVDANEAWKSKEEALANLTWLAADKRIEFVEQPMPADTPLRDMEWLKERSPLPIIADESYHTARDLNSVVTAFHGVNVKLCKAGGLTHAVEALRAARCAGLKTMLGCMIESSVLISAAAHLAELCDFLDLDGNLLITNDPFEGVTATSGILSFSQAKQPHGIQVTPR